MRKNSINFKRFYDALTFHRRKLNSDEWLQVAFGVLEGEVTSEEALFAAQAVIFNHWMQTKSLNIRWAFTLTRDPNHFQALSGGVTLLYVSLQCFWHLFWQRVFLFVVVWLPIEDFIELKEDAGTSFLILKLVLGGAGLKSRQVNFTGLLVTGSFFTAVDGIAGSLFEV